MPSPSSHTRKATVTGWPLSFAMSLAAASEPAPN
jgi:hypothetical protein